jgi:hypothetical protein
VAAIFHAGCCANLGDFATSLLASASSALATAIADGSRTRDRYRVITTLSDRSSLDLAALSIGIGFWKNIASFMIPM